MFAALDDVGDVLDVLAYEWCRHVDLDRHRSQPPHDQSSLRSHTLGDAGLVELRCDVDGGVGAGDSDDHSRTRHLVTGGSRASHAARDARLLVWLFTHASPEEFLERIRHLR